MSRRMLSSPPSPASEENPPRTTQWYDALIIANHATNSTFNIFFCCEMSHFASAVDEIAKADLMSAKADAKGTVVERLA